MKASSGLFAVFLILWSGASVYWYVCKIKKDCNKQNTEIISEKNKEKTNTEITEIILNNKTEIKDTGSAVTNLKEKLKNGYVLSGFKINSSVNKIDSDFESFAENLKIYLKKDSSVKIMITGYTDNTGTPEVNLDIGKKRADFLKSKLIEKGIDQERILTDTKGRSNPAADNNSEKGRKQNRRAVIIIINN